MGHDKGNMTFPSTCESMKEDRIRLADPPSLPADM